MATETAKEREIPTERNGEDRSSPTPPSSSTWMQLREEESLWGKLYIMGTFILRRMEDVGEGVAWFLGLDESKFQYIISEILFF